MYLSPSPSSSLPPQPFAIDLHGSYLVIDARSHEEHASSGGGVLRGSLRLDPQVSQPVSQGCTSSLSFLGVRVCV